MDGNGFIAGVQSAVPDANRHDDRNYDFTKVPYYQVDDFFGNDAWYVTVYFVDPAIICNGGRTREEFEAEGTGNRIAVQNGPTPDSLEIVPLDQAGVDDEAVSCVCCRFFVCIG